MVSDPARREHMVDFSERQAVELAEFLAVLIREGITYIVHNKIGGWTVELTGGF